MPTTLIKNIKRLYGHSDIPMSFKKGEQMKDVNSTGDAYVLFDRQILSFGSMSSCPESADHVIDATNKLVFPAWCDSHTHIVFATSREQEFVMRLNGKTYEEIAKAGGGILQSAQKLRESHFEDLHSSALHRLHEVISMGTGAIEIKSGYGLSFESEVLMLEVIKHLKLHSDASVKSTFLGAHAIPAEYKDNRQEYIRIVTEDMLPYIADKQLADYIDVFCDEGFFTVKETDYILKKGQEYGLKPKIHANELANSGGVQIGISNKAISVDHLERIGEKEIEALKNSSTIPTALPNVSFFLDIPYAPCRQMIDNGLGIALASDYNPGSTPSGNIPLLMAMACHQMKLLPNEAFQAVTINGAYAMEENEKCGSITPGKWANIILTDEIPGLDYFIYHFGQNHVESVWLKGSLQKN